MSSDNNTDIMSSDNNTDIIDIDQFKNMLIINLNNISFLKEQIKFFKNCNNHIINNINNINNNYDYYQQSIIDDIHITEIEQFIETEIETEINNTFSNNIHFDDIDNNIQKLIDIDIQNDIKLKQTCDLYININKISTNIINNIINDIIDNIFNNNLIQNQNNQIKDKLIKDNLIQNNQIQNNQIQNNQIQNIKIQNIEDKLIQNNQIQNNQIQNIKIQNIEDKSNNIINNLFNNIKKSKSRKSWNWKTRFCHFDVCTKLNCSYAHNDDELYVRNKNPYWKVTICPNYYINDCNKTDKKCMFAHGEDDLREPHPCKFKDDCTNENCIFWHISDGYDYM
jgi:hypothetical protein